MTEVLANLLATLALGVEENMTIPVCGKWVVTPSEDEFQEVNVVSIYDVKKKIGVTR